MKIFILLSNAPHSGGEAIEVVGHEVVEKAQQLGHSVVLQVLFRDPRGSAAAKQAEQTLREVKLPDVVVCPMLYVEDVADLSSKRGWVSRLGRLFTSLTLRRMFPASGLGSVVERRVREAGADAILSIWSWEALAATYHIPGVPKFVYYGNPDHLPMQARLRHPDLFGLRATSMKDRLWLWFERVRNERRKRLNISMMNACEVTANNSVLDAAFYRDHGHPQSIYLQNMWPPVTSAPRPVSLSGPQPRPIKIIGSVGNLGATGNTFALTYLGRELLPRLAVRFKDRPFEVHLLGKGTPSAAAAAVLDNPRVKIRGWVEDINEEFRSASLFLVLTNVNADFLVGNTRILLAWALGTCVIMHENSRLAMPEIEHGVNALLGKTPDELAEQIVAAVDDEALRQRIGQGGQRTFETYYRSDVVVPKMFDLVQNMVDRCRPATALATGTAVH
ncbi:MAG: glycosyltransferase family 4 protein [Nitrospira sp.]|nr:glycosyltransferase family 4 protein [Nitrospira sp.]